MSPALGALFAAIGAVLSGTGIAGLRRVRAQNRLDAAKAENSEADAVKTWQALYQDLQGRVQQMESQMSALLEKDRHREHEMSELRDAARAAAADAAEARLEAQRARTEKALAETRVAELEADLARALKEAGDERHALRAEFAEYRIEQEQREVELRRHYESEIASLRAEIAALKTQQAQQGQLERRESDRRTT